MCICIYLHKSQKPQNVLIQSLSLYNILLHKFDFTFNLVLLHLFQYFVLPPRIEERFIDFGILSATEASHILFAIINSNPIEVKKKSVFIQSYLRILFKCCNNHLHIFLFFKLAIKSWHIIGDGLSIELIATERGNKTTIISSLPEFETSSLSDQSSVSNPPCCFLKHRRVSRHRVKGRCPVTHFRSCFCGVRSSSGCLVLKGPCRSSASNPSLYDKFYFKLKGIKFYLVIRSSITSRI